MSNPIPVPAPDRAAFARRIAELRTQAPSGSNYAVGLYGALEADFETLAREARHGLLGTSLAWSEDQRREAAWLRHASEDLAHLGYTLCEAQGPARGEGDARIRGLMARTLQHMGDTVKWAVAVTREVPHDFGKPNAIMRAAIAGAQHRIALRMRFDERERPCTIESLYFRMLLLARLSSGALNVKQMEILDAWMWLWMPALHGVEACPGEGALRVDLDSVEGLRIGRRPDAGASLYLPAAPIEEAYASIVREFHAGRMVPAEGITTTFRLEEHVTVLDLIRKGLRRVTEGEVARAPRQATDYQVELFVGLSEVLTRAFNLAPMAAPQLTLAARDGQRLELLRMERDHDAVGDVYERRRRMVRVANVSDTGFGIEGKDPDCAGISVGDIVALRLGPACPLEICKVVRSVPSASVGCRWIGVRRLSSNARPIEVLPSMPADRGPDPLVLFVPGEDESGRYDACLVTERTFAEEAPLQAFLGGCLYTFKFNRPRERGRGWVLAGFEIVAAVPDAVRIA